MDVIHSWNKNALMEGELRFNQLPVMEPLKRCVYREKKKMIPGKRQEVQESS